jgi:hypothetical protein
MLLLELVHLIENVAEDVAAVEHQLPVLVAVVLGLLELLAQLRDFFFQILGVVWEG